VSYSSSGAPRNDRRHLRSQVGVEEGRQLRRRVLLHGRQDVRVDAQRHLDLRVPEPTLDDVRRDTGGQHQRRDGMPQAVELDPTDARGLDQPGELPIANRVDLERQAERSARLCRSPHSFANTRRRSV